MISTTTLMKLSRLKGGSQGCEPGRQEASGGSHGCNPQASAEKQGHAWRKTMAKREEAKPEFDESVSNYIRICLASCNSRTNPMTQREEEPKGSPVPAMGGYQHRAVRRLWCTRVRGPRENLKVKEMPGA